MLACEELTKLVDWGSESGQIDLDIAARLGDLCGDPDVAAAMTVVVEERLAVEHAVLPGRNHRAGLLLGGIEDGLDRGLDNRRAEFRKQIATAGARPDAPRRPSPPDRRENRADCGR